MKDEAGVSASYDRLGWMLNDLLQQELEADARWS